MSTIHKIIKFCFWVGLPSINDGCVKQFFSVRTIHFDNQQYFGSFKAHFFAVFGHCVRIISVWFCSSCQVQWIFKRLLTNRQTICARIFSTIFIKLANCVFGYVQHVREREAAHAKANFKLFFLIINSLKFSFWFFLNKRAKQT